MCWDICNIQVQCSYDVLGQYAAFQNEIRRKTMLFHKFGNVAIKHEQPPLLTQW